jgi:hypothetical protein
LQQDALARQTAMSAPAASGAAPSGPAARQAASVVEFTLRYEVAK